MAVTCPDALKGARVFLTGGAGFLAANLIESIIEHCEVVAYDNLRRNSLVHAPWRSHPHLELIVGDVLDAALVRRAIAGADYVVHLAAIAGVRVVVHEPVSVFLTNLLGTQVVLDAAKSACPDLRRFIDFSTSEVYGPRAYHAAEDQPTVIGTLHQPRWYYAASKLASEFLTHGYYTQYGMPTCSVRPFNVFGPYQLGDGAVRNFVAAVRAGEALTVHGHGDEVRSWCYVDDMTRATLLCLTQETAIGQSFNVGNPHATTSTLELAHAIIRLSGRTVPIQFRPIAYPEVEVRVPSISRAMNLLGYEPQVNLEDGLRRTLDWWDR